VSGAGGIQQGPVQFAPAKNIKDAEAWAKKNGFELKGVKNKQMANVINEQVFNDMKKLGMVDDAGAGFVEIEKSGIAGGAEGAGGIKIKGPRTTLSGLGEDLQAALKDYSIVDYSGTDNFIGTLNHELGHKRYFNPKSIPKEMRTKISAATKDLRVSLESGEMIPSDFGGYVNMFSRGKKFTDLSSGRAFDLIQEAWAETYGAVRSGYANKLSTNVKGFIRRHPDVF